MDQLSAGAQGTGNQRLEEVLGWFGLGTVLAGASRRVSLLRQLLGKADGAAAVLPERARCYPRTASWRRRFPPRPGSRADACPAGWKRKR